MVVPKQLPTMILKPGFRIDKTNEGWRPVEEPQLSLSGFLEEAEGWVSGREMIERGKSTEHQLGMLASQHHAEAMLDHQEEIPVEWRMFRLAACGTIWQDSDGCRRVPCLHWRGSWVLDFYYLDIDSWDGSVRLVRVSKESS